MKYRKKPVVIEAFHMTREQRDSMRDWPQWLHAAWGSLGISPRLMTARVGVPEGECDLEIETLEGAHRVTFGDYIIRGVKGELYPCKPDIFAATYEHEDGRPVIVLGSVVRAKEGSHRPKMTVEGFGEAGSVSCVFFEEDGSGPFRCVYGPKALEVVS